MPDYQFERECRTPYSEAYIITLDSVRVGRIDLHYTSSIVYGALAVEEQLLEDDILDLIETIDEDLVMTADVARDDFVVSVAQGRTLGEYRDES
ncbi:MAG: hypothetical protein Q7O66_13125, partial [Dehalococcoidia bacterium]|nr:hypothetical protein [Dehalococcoidia bacterium]